MSSRDFFARIFSRHFNRASSIFRQCKDLSNISPGRISLVGNSFWSDFPLVCQTCKKTLLENGYALVCAYRTRLLGVVDQLTHLRCILLVCSGDGGDVRAFLLQLPSACAGAGPTHPCHAGASGTDRWRGLCPVSLHHWGDEPRRVWLWGWGGCVAGINF